MVSRRSAALLLVLLQFSIAPGFAQDADIVISEFMAVNSSTLADEDGDSSDWVEVHNQGFSSVDIDGWYLTDDDNDLDRWRFPSVTLDGGGRLLVFASGKDRRDAAGELHTSFRLAGDGEFLALVRPDGDTIAHAYAPQYPRQRPDISYGVGRDLIVEALAPARSSARVLIPQNDTLGTTWTGGDEPFDDSSWIDGTTGVGYLNSQPGFATRVIIPGGDVSSLATAEDVASDPTPGGQFSGEIAAVVNYYNTGGRGHHLEDATFPGLTIGTDVNDFVVVVTGTVTIPAAGAWTFGVNSDDGFSLELTGAGESFRIEFPQPRGPGDTLGVFNAPAAGAYDLRLVMYERGGGAEVELFARRGSFGSWSSDFRLVGDTANGGLEVNTDVSAVGALSVYRNLIGTDVEKLMLGVASSAFVRVPFEVEPGASFDSLTLRMRYDDGIAAYLNGAEIARSNAPESPAYDALAPTDRSTQQALSWHEIDVSEHGVLLRDGTNILALHGLNDSIDSDDFLLVGELAEITVESMAEGYFEVPTPGGENESAFLDFVGDTSFDHDRGFYDAPFAVAITTTTVGAEIRYTTNGSAPTETTGTVYVGPIPIDRTTTLRTAAFKTDFIPSNVDSQTYIFPDDVLTQDGAGFPDLWRDRQADYEVDPDVTGDPLYRDDFLDDLKSLPSLSIVMDLGDIFDRNRGIYSNSGGSGISWERPGSIELILPDGMEIPGGGDGFQVNCAVRMHGGVGRNSSVPKHSWRFLFKGDYGPTKLDYPIFAASPQLAGAEATDKFDTLILRAGFNNSWVWNSSGENRRAQYLRDQFIRDSLLAMGTPAPHGSFVHVWVNGLYWGVYNLVERPSAPFAAAYFGGSKDEWDVLNSGEPVDGSRDAWSTLHGIVGAGGGSDASYDEAQEYLDVSNLIDYMIANLYGGNGDWDGHNWYAGRHDVPGAGYKFFSWDAERTLEGVSANRTGINNGGNPSGLYGVLRSNASFRLAFGDRLHEHFFNSGAMTPERTVARYRLRAEEIHAAIVGESARWGDTWRAAPYTRDVEWATERDRLLGDYLPRRTQIVLSQFRGIDLYPNVDAPRFSQHGGRIEPGFSLVITTTSGTIYYTLDGTDPRLPSGGLNPTADVAGEVRTTTFIGEDTAVRVLVPQDDSLGLDWTQHDFDDGTWTEGSNGVGYERGSGYEDFISTSVEKEMFGINASVYIRIPFVVDDPDTLAFLSFRIRYEDGFIAYLNGERITERNAPADPAWNSTATTNHSDGEAIVFESIDLPESARSFLRAGNNVLAIHGLNVGTGSSDLLIEPALETAESSGQGILLDRTTTVKSRSRLDGEWSALNQARFTIDAQLPLRITEIMYHPPATGKGSPWSADDLEFIELKNVGNEVISLSRVRFLVGIEFEFTGSAVTSLAPGEHVVVVRDLAAFESFYDSSGMLVAGEYDGQLSNSGESIALVDASDDIVHSFRFEDAWYPSTDGIGHSLVIVNALLPSDQWGEASSWNASQNVDGSPGFDEGDAVPTGRQRAGDSNQDGVVDVSDAVHLLRRLFGAIATPPPCEGATLAEGSNVDIFDVNGDDVVDVSDAVHFLDYLFRTGPPPERGTRCERLPGCPSVCVP